MSSVEPVSDVVQVRFRQLHAVQPQRIIQMEWSIQADLRMLTLSINISKWRLLGSRIMSVIRGVSRHGGSHRATHMSGRHELLMGVVIVGNESLCLIRIPNLIWIQTCLSMHGSGLLEILRLYLSAIVNGRSCDDRLLVLRYGEVLLQNPAEYLKQSCLAYFSSTHLSENTWWKLEGPLNVWKTLAPT